MRITKKYVYRGQIHDLKDMLTIKNKLLIYVRDIAETRMMIMQKR